MNDNSIISTHLLWELLVLLCGWCSNISYIPYAYKRIRKSQLKSNMFDRRYIYSSVTLQIILLGVRVLFYEQRGVFIEIRFAVLLNLLFAISRIDRNLFRIPDCLIMYGMIVRGILLLAEIATRPKTIIPFAISVAAAISMVAIIFGITRLIDREGIGLGDLKLMLLIAVYTGCEGTILILAGTVLMLFLVSVWELRKKKENRRKWFAFAPYVLISYYLLLLFDVM